MKTRSLSLSAALFGALFLLRPAHAVMQNAGSAFDGNGSVDDQDAGDTVSAGDPAQKANNMTAVGHGSYYAQRPLPPPPHREPSNDSGSDLTGLAGGAVGAGALLAAAKWGLPWAFGVTLGPVGLLGAALLGGAAGSFMMHDKALAIGLGAAAAGVMIASVAAFPPLGLVVTAMALGGAGYFVGKKFFS